MSFHIVEYLDEKTRKPTGNYAKRFADHDEPIPKRRFCVCDAAGNIKSITEVNFSQAIEVEGKPHCMELQDGDECHAVSDTECPECPADIKAGERLNWLLDNHKMGRKAQGKRKMVKRG